MIRGLVIAAAGGAVLSIGCFSVMHALGPVSVTSHFDFSDADDRRDRSPRVTRDLPWNGGSRIEISLPAEVIYTQGPAARITAEGPQDRISTITLSNNIISDDKHPWRWRSRHHNGIVLHITAPALSDLTISSAASAQLNNIALPELKLSVSGAASIDGSGHADKVTLSSAGASSMNLSAMAIKDADISIAGAGSVKAGPTDRASISISGVGSVTLTRTPHTLEKHITGLGSVSVSPERSDETSKDTDDDGVSF
ncbi:GIN domain-containing protein [Acetobacter oeni]|uniref:Putative auto-transporter adhesin head GIN domain-containing protein n=1 Tax=Acetobacter oeni TaxID=304077 RepID=A0A511XLR1_9PROT|nr:DUF2807 domain-containing protein [Acetobacter oeni]MBB3881836.1 hypothetical protein [Acetobacter oeni]NHO17837.1 DUF2807 domain-containing protein [Acetobacter oeni]GBR07588.1 hypothetical protein AA21952_2379 [Acetobacter oeni LMG 21952]GEN63879.1 hypothetical protein AOE01nite_21030 [Acetobacter oeni]